MVIEWVILVKEVLVDLIHYWLLRFRHLDGDPLCYHDGDAAANDIVPWLLLLGLSNQGIRDEGVEIDMVGKDVSCKTNGGVY